MARTKNGFVMSKKKIETKLKNDAAFTQYFNDLKNISQSTFLYEGLPETIDTAYLEKILFDYGSAAIFEEPDIGLVCLPCTMAGKFDLYGVPVAVRAFSGYTGFNRLLHHNSYSIEKSDCVIIYNISREFSSSIYKGSIAAYAERLADDIRTEDINIYAQRTPIVMAVPDTQVETFVNTIDRYENYSKIVFGYKGFDAENLKALRTDAPFVANQINEHRTRIWNEALGFMGVSNISTYKKERVSTDEVARSMGGAIAHRNARQKPRELAVDQINKKWGEKYGFKAEVSFNEALFDLELDPGLNLLGYNRAGMQEGAAENE